MPKNINKLREQLSLLQDKKVLTVGDVMLDQYLMGDAERISPEAPVPIVRVSHEECRIGGAGNVAANIKALGGNPLLCSICGKGSNGSLLLSMLRAQGITDEFEQYAGRRTSIKTRVLARQQQILRFDREDIDPVQGAMLQRVLKRLSKRLPDVEVVIISDYGKGLISKELLDGVRSLCAQQKKPPLLLVDPKSPNYQNYSDVDLLTPNAKETSEAAMLPTGTREEILAAGLSIMERLRCKHLLTTLGPQGMALFISPEEVWHLPTTARQVYDVTGAGDTVIASVGLGLASGMDLLTACQLANYAAGVVVAKVGTATATLPEIITAIKEYPAPAVTRWK